MATNRFPRSIRRYGQFSERLNPIFSYTYDDSILVMRSKTGHEQADSFSLFFQKKGSKFSEEGFTTLQISTVRFTTFPNHPANS